MVKLFVNFCGRQSCIPHEGVVFLSQSSLHTNKTWQLEIPHQPGPWRKKPVWRPGCWGKLPGLILLHARYLLATLCLLTNAKSLSEVKRLSPVFPSTWVRRHHYMQSFSVVASVPSPQIPAPGSPGCLLALSPDTLYIAFELKKGVFVGRVGSWLLPDFSEGTEQWSAEAGWEFTPASEFIITEQVSQESPRAAWLNHHCAVSRSQ